MSKKSKLGILLMNKYINKHIKGYTNDTNNVTLVTFILLITMVSSENGVENEQEKFRELRK